MYIIVSIVRASKNINIPYNPNLTSGNHLPLYSCSFLFYHCAVASESFNLSWVNCEMASFIHMKASAKFYNNPKEEVRYIDFFLCAFVI